MTKRFHFIVAGLALALGLAGSAQAGPWEQQRAEQRRQRQELSELAAQDLQKRAESAAAVIDKMLSRVESGELKANRADLWHLVAGLARLSPEHLGDLPLRVRGLSDDHVGADPAWPAALQQAREQLTARPWELLQRAADVGSVELAADFMWEVLYFDPDFEAIRKALGQVKVEPELLDKAMPPAPNRTGRGQDQIPEIANYDPDRYWLTAFNAARLREGFIWTPAYGWAMAQYPQRYRDGYVYDLDRRKWTTMDEANQYHSRTGHDWVVPTQHIELHGSADLQILADAATKLEALYREIFRVFAGFFSDSRRVDALRLALGLGDHPPLKIWLYRDHDEYVRRSGAVEWSGGVFNSGNGVAYFYGRANDTMFHEFTHQVLQVMTGRNGSPAWLTEGIATYTMTVRFDLGRAVIPGMPYEANIALNDLLEINSNKAWYRAVEQAMRQRSNSPYQAAGSLCTFCMNGEDGRFRSDFVDFLRDSYRGAARNYKVWDYLGISQQDFAQQYAQWGAGARFGQ